MDIETTIGRMLDGVMPESEAIAFLCELRDRGETASDITAAVEAVMARAVPFDAPAGAIDVCGTGGDGRHTFNISTAVAFVAAASGAVVVKHGNRAVSSRSGSSDVLAALGIPNDLPASFWEKVVAEMGIAFLHAPLFHPGLVRMAGIRKQIGTRTIFNLLGPLCNPARVKRQVIGVYEARLVPMIAEVLRAQGYAHAWVVHGEDGGDEISISGPTLIAEVKDGNIEEFSLAPEDVGFERQPPEALKGGDAEANAEAMRRIFAGEKNAYWDAVMLNTAAALIVAGKAQSLPAAMEMAATSLHYHAAFNTLNALTALIDEFTHV